MSEKEKTAIVLVNLGTPAQPDTRSVRRFLKEFLSDTRVIEGRGPKRWLWLTMLNCIVLQARPAKLAKLYRDIWQQGSPMRNILQSQASKLAVVLAERHPHAPEVFATMSYGESNISVLLASLKERGYQKIFVMPLYPQYSATSTAVVYDKVAQFQQSCREVLDIRILKSYYGNSDFIKALVHSLEQHWKVSPPAQITMLSYHGIPQHYADAGDPYQQHCLQTTALVIAALKNGEFSQQADNIISTFQSRFGPTKWLQPYTDLTLENLAKEGVVSIDVICPAFSADCLETLEEIAQTNKTLFIKNGGREYRYIPALNDQPLFIECLYNIVEQQAGDWLGEKIEA